MGVEKARSSPPDHVLDERGRQPASGNGQEDEGGGRGDRIGADYHPSAEAGGRDENAEDEHDAARHEDLNPLAQIRDPAGEGPQLVGKILHPQTEREIRPEHQRDRQRQEQTDDQQGTFQWSPLWGIRHGRAGEEAFEARSNPRPGAPQCHAHIRSHVSNNGDREISRRMQCRFMAPPMPGHCDVGSPLPIIPSAT